jgi:hypothetical protein
MQKYEKVTNSQKLVIYTDETAWTEILRSKKEDMFEERRVYEIWDTYDDRCSVTVPC